MGYAFDHNGPKWARWKTEQIGAETAEARQLVIGGESLARLALRR